MLRIIMRVVFRDGLVLNIRVYHHSNRHTLYIFSVIIRESFFSVGIFVINLVIIFLKTFEFIFATVNKTNDVWHPISKYPSVHTTHTHHFLK